MDTAAFPRPCLPFSRPSRLYKKTSGIPVRVNHEDVLEFGWYDSHCWVPDLSVPIVRSLNHLIIADYHIKRAGFPFP